MAARETSPEDKAGARAPSGATPRAAALRYCGCLLLLLAAAACITLLLAPSLARWFPSVLTETTPPARADALVVLAGDHRGGRVDAAVALFREGHVPEGPFVLSGGPLYGETTWAELMRERALAGGVPSERLLLQARSRTTVEDARFTRDALRLPPGSTLILVTSPWHSGRAAAHFREAFGAEVTILSCPSAPRDGDWWRDAEDTRALATEVLKRLWPGEGG